MERIPKLIKFPKGLVEEKDNYISSFSGAVDELIRKGLKKDKCYITCGEIFK